MSNDFGLGNISNTGNNSTFDTSFKYEALPDPVISQPAYKPYTISDDLKSRMKTYTDNAVNPEGIDRIPEKTESLMDNVLGYGGLAINLYGALQAKKAQDFSQKVTQFNMANAAKKTAFREKAIGGINNVGRNPVIANTPTTGFA